MSDQNDMEIGTDEDTSTGSHNNLALFEDHVSSFTRSLARGYFFSRDALSVT
jgi:hypothetical protein